jgi:hypothetical protein
MAARLAAAALVGCGVVELCGLAVRAAIGPLHLGTPDLVAALAAGVGGLLLAVNRVTDRSAGAVDNASGVVAAFATLDALPVAAE